MFYDGEMTDFAAFQTWLQAADKDARFVADADGKIKALYWLNNPLGKSAMIHFCFLRQAFCEQEAIGRYVVKSLLFCRDKRGGYVLSALYGLTPKPYRHALAFIRKLGFRLVAELPEALSRNNFLGEMISPIPPHRLFLFHKNKRLSIII